MMSKKNRILFFSSICTIIFIAYWLIRYENFYIRITIKTNKIFRDVESKKLVERKMESLGKKKFLTKLYALPVHNETAVEVIMPTFTEIVKEAAKKNLATRMAWAALEPVIQETGLFEPFNEAWKDAAKYDGHKVKNYIIERSWRLLSTLASLLMKGDFAGIETYLGSICWVIAFITSESLKTHPQLDFLYEAVAINDAGKKYFMQFAQDPRYTAYLVPDEIIESVSTYIINQILHDHGHLEIKRSPQITLTIKAKTPSILNQIFNLIQNLPQKIKEVLLAKSYYGFEFKATLIVFILTIETYWFLVKYHKKKKNINYAKFIFPFLLLILVIRCPEENLKAYFLFFILFLEWGTGEFLKFTTNWIIPYFYKLLNIIKPYFINVIGFIMSKWSQIWNYLKISKLWDSLKIYWFILTYLIDWNGSNNSKWIASFFLLLIVITIILTRKLYTSWVLTAEKIDTRKKSI